MTDLEITCLLTSVVMGIAAFFSLPTHFRNNRRRCVTCFSASVMVGLVSGLIAVRATEPLEGSAIIRSKDSELYLVWGTDDVMVRVAATCGLAGAIVGAAAKGIESYFGKGEGFSGSEVAENGRNKQVGWTMISSGAVIGFLGGALAAGLPAALILTIIRSVR